MEESPRPTVAENPAPPVTQPAYDDHGKSERAYGRCGGWEVQSLAESNTRKRIEINFCRNVRNVADAMQMSGWRRTAFVRLPAMQRTFSIHLRRLFLLGKIQEGTRLTTGERRFYNRNPWTTRETRTVYELDRYLLSETRAIKFIDRARFEELFQDGAEAEIGRWLAWKDHEVRSGSHEKVKFRTGHSLPP